MTIQVFGHKSPDTDSTGSPIAWAWYLSSIRGEDAKPVLLGEPNTEAAFMLQRWGLDKPEIISDVEAGAPVVIVDTNNPAELPASINAADITAIIDHHKLVGGLETKGPIDITMRPLACTATILYDLMGDDVAARRKFIETHATEVDHPPSRPDRGSDPPLPHARPRLVLHRLKVLPVGA